MVDVPSRDEHTRLDARVTAADSALSALEETSVAQQGELGIIDRTLDAHAANLDALAVRIAALESAGGGGGAALPQVAPLHADRVLDRFGINDRLNYNSGPYQHRDATSALVVELGVRSIRDLITGNLPKAKWDAIAWLASKGIKTHGTVARVGDDQATIAAACAAVKSRADLFCSVGGTNEPNAGGGTAWPAATAQQQAWVFSAMFGSGIPVAGPALKDNVADIGGDFRKLGATGIAASVDFGDFHRYPRGDKPTNGLAERQQMAIDAFGGKPTYCTEGGYNTSASGVPEDVAAVYAPRQMLEMVHSGVGRFHIFELLDQSADPSVFAGHYGLVACPSDDPEAWRKKPSFDAVADLCRFLADPGPAYTPPPVGVTVEGPDDLRSIVIGKRDGSTYALLWRDVGAGDPPVDVTVTDARGPRTVPVGDKWASEPLSREAAR